MAQLLGGRRDAARVAELLSQLGLTKRAGGYTAELSGGELCRAGLAIALANDPKVLLADEPTGEVDSATEQRVLDLLNDRADRGVAVVVVVVVVVVTHSEAVAASADRVVKLADGRVAA